MDIFDTHVLNGVVDERVEPVNFLTNTFFGEVSESEEETIYFDRTAERRLVTPFVSPLHEGKVITEAGYETDSFKPAYAKDLRIFNPRKGFKRRPGEKIGGQLTPQQRLEAAVAFNIDEQLAMLNRRFEVMAGDVLVNGKATISGEAYPTKIVDFKRKAELRDVLAGADQWAAGKAGMIQQLEDWAQMVFDASGVAPDRAVMTSDAWKLLKTDPAFDKLIDTTKAQTGGAVIQTGPTLFKKDGVRKVGVAGDLELYVYSGRYVDPEDMQEKDILPAFTVLVGSPGVDGVRHFGAIQDLDAGLQARQYFVKSWTVPNPSARYLLMQSAPLLVPYRVNAVGAFTVQSA